MATHETGSTVSPVIPKGLINAADLEMIGALGYQYEESHKNSECWYFYQEDYASNELYIEYVREFLHDLAQEYPADACRPNWVSILETALAEAGEEDGEVELDLDSLCVDIGDVFTGILNKPENTGEKALDVIEIEGASWCSKAQPDSHGGWCVRITREGATWGGTSHLMVAMAKGLYFDPYSRYFVITGRIPGFDDDDTHIIQADDIEEAGEVFTNTLYQEHVNETRENSLDRYGEVVYIVSAFELNESAAVKADASNSSRKLFDRMSACACEFAAFEKVIESEEPISQEVADKLVATYGHGFTSLEHVYNDILSRARAED